MYKFKVCIVFFAVFPFVIYFYHELYKYNIYIENFSNNVYSLRLKKTGFNLNFYLNTFIANYFFVHYLWLTYYSFVIFKNSFVLIRFTAPLLLSLFFILSHTFLIFFIVSLVNIFFETTLSDYDNDYENVYKESYQTKYGSESDVFIGKVCDQTGSYCLDNVLIINSGINASLIKPLRELYANNSEIKTICINSNGGGLFATRDVILFIQENKLSTCIADKYFENGIEIQLSSRCNSACPLILMSATHRIRIGVDQSIYVHSAGKEIDKGMFIIKKSVDTSGFFDDFLDEEYQLEFMNFAFMTHFVYKYKMTESDISNYQLFTSVFGSSSKNDAMMESE